MLPITSWALALAYTFNCCIFSHMSEDKLPAAHDYVLQQLHCVVDSLRKENMREALCYVGDALEYVQDEIDWCYRTDKVLPFILSFLIQLGDTLTTVEQTTPELKNEHTKAIIKEITQLIDQQQNIAANVPRRDPPAPYIDLLEKEHRARTYGLDLYDPTHEENWRKK